MSSNEISRKIGRLRAEGQALDRKIEEATRACLTELRRMLAAIHEINNSLDEARFLQPSRVCESLPHISRTDVAPVYRLEDDQTWHNPSRSDGLTGIGIDTGLGSAITFNPFKCEWKYHPEIRDAFKNTKLTGLSFQETLSAYEDDLAAWVVNRAPYHVRQEQDNNKRREEISRIEAGRALEKTKQDRKEILIVIAVLGGPMLVFILIARWIWQVITHP